MMSGKSQSVITYARARQREATQDITDRLRDRSYKKIYLS